MAYECLTVERKGKVYIITLRISDENRLTSKYCQEIIRAYHDIQQQIGPDSEAAVLMQGNNNKFFCTGLDLDEEDTNPFANTDGFYPMLHTICDFPYPTVALLTGHTFGGACLFALSHDYRVMNSERGFFCMPPIELGLHFDGIGALPKAKLAPRTVRKLLQEAHRFTGKEALEHDIVDVIATPDKMFGVALGLAEKWAPKAKMGVYAAIRSEQLGDALAKFKVISYVHGRRANNEPKAKI